MATSIHGFGSRPTFVPLGSSNPVPAVQSNARDRYLPPYPSPGYLLFTVREINSGSFRACLRYSRDRLKSAKEICVSSRPRGSWPFPLASVRATSRMHEDHVSYLVGTKERSRRRDSVSPKIKRGPPGRSSNGGNERLLDDNVATGTR